MQAKRSGQNTCLNLHCKSVQKRNAIRFCDLQSDHIPHFLYIHGILQLQKETL